MCDPTGNIQTTEQSAGQLFRIKLSEMLQPHKSNRFFHILFPECLIADIKSTEIINIFRNGQFIENRHILHDNTDL